MSKHAYSWGLYYTAIRQAHTKDETLKNDLKAVLTDLHENEPLRKRVKRIHDTVEKRVACDVCKNSVINLQITVCGHKFCRDCIEPIYRSTSKCPTCRKHIRKK